MLGFFILYIIFLNKREEKMFKKTVATFALLTAMSYASWDNLPILQQGEGQTAGQIGYMSMDPVSGPLLAVGVRYSPLSWLEISAKAPFGFFSIEGNKGYGDSNSYGIMNVQFGLKFQLSTGFSLYADGYLPGSNDFAQDNFAGDFGLQHSNLFTRVIWAKYLGYMLGEAQSNQYFHFGTEFDFLFSSFSIYASLDIIIGEEAQRYNCSMSGNCSYDEGGSNGIIVDLGFKIPLTDELTLDAAVEITGGSRFNIEGVDEPMIFSAALFYNF